ncbi:GxxExxY protein [Methanococcoides sp. SA1]|nr:GxxExxY protein [Methanococcoides sp. SA1]
MDDDVTEKIIGCFYRVYNALGFGLTEKIYGNAMALEFEDVGLKFAREVPLNVVYVGKVVGEYFADFIIGDVIVELKAVRELCGVESQQVLNYLRAGGFEVGLVLNFGLKAEVRRKIKSW